MSDSTPTPIPAPTTAIVNPDPIRRLRNLTILSLSLNGVILLLLVVGGVIHHHRMKMMRQHQDFGGRDGGFHDGCPMDRDFGHRFHHFGGGFGPGQGWGHRDGFDRDAGGPPPRMPGMGGMMEAPKGPPDPAKMTDIVMDHLTLALTLTDDQKAKVKPIIEAQVADMQKEMEARKAAMQKEISDTKDKLKPILNADQQKKLDELPIPGQKPPDAKPGE